MRATIEKMTGRDARMALMMIEIETYMKTDDDGPGHETPEGDEKGMVASCRFCEESAVSESIIFCHGVSRFLDDFQCLNSVS